MYFKSQWNRIFEIRPVLEKSNIFGGKSLDLLNSSYF